MKIKALITVALIALAAMSVIVPGAVGKTTAPAPIVQPNVNDPGDGGGTYPYYTGYCQIDGHYDNDPNSYGPGDTATLGSLYVRCDGAFFYDVAGSGLHYD